MSGEVVKSFASPGNRPHGLAFDGKYLWNCDNVADKIYRLDLDGNVVKSFASPGNLPAGLAFDGKYLWNSDNGTYLIYQLRV